LEIPKIPIEDLLAKTIKALTGEKTSLNNIGLKLQMHTGKILQGKILNILPKKKAVILVGGEKIIVALPEHSQKRQGNHFSTEVQNAYRPGKSIYLKVEKIKPSLILKVTSSFEHKNQDEGYTTNISPNIKTKIIKFNDYKFPLYKNEPDKIIRNSKETSPDYSKFQSNDRLDKKVYGKNEYLKLLKTLNSTPPSSQKNQKNEFSKNFSRNTKTEKFDLPIFRDLKLLPNKIIPVKILNAVDKNTLMVQFKGQNFLVKNDCADLYKPGVTVDIQIQKVKDIFKPVLVDPPKNFNKLKNSEHIPIQQNNNSFRSIHSSPVKYSNNDGNFQAKFYNEDKNYGNKLLGPPADLKNAGFESLKPYLGSRKVIGRLIVELKLEILESPVFKNIPIKSDLLIKFRKTLQQLTPKLNSTFSETDTKRQVDLSGITYESKIKKLLLQPETPKIRFELCNDLKGQLLELKQILEDIIKTNPERNLSRQIFDFQQKIKVVVDSIEFNQLSSRLSNQENQPLLLQIPNPIDSNDKSINLYVHKGSNENKDGKKSDKGNYNLAFYLELSELGNIKMNVDMDSNSMKVRMDLERDDVVEFVRNNATDFKNSMKNKGFSATVECCNVNKTSQIKDSLAELLVSKNTSLFSVKT